MMFHLAFAASLSMQNSSYEALEVTIMERDTWAFCQMLTEINTTLGRLIPSPTHILNLRTIQNWILNDLYAWLIQPNTCLLSNYILFSNCIYGELMLLFVDKIIELMQLS